MIRKGQLLINTDILSMLHKLTKLDGLGSAENAAELLLGEALAKRPELADWVKRRELSRKRDEKEWQAAWGIGDDIPMKQLEAAR